MLQALAAAISLDISQIEARHSSNREMSLMRARGWIPSLLTVTAAFVTRTFSSLSGNRFNSSPDLATDDGDSFQQPSKRNRRSRTKRGGGGAWRAFIHAKTKGGSRLTGADFSRLSQEYQNLSPADKEFYQVAGERGAQAHAAGFSSFGSQPESGSRSSVVPRPGLTLGAVDGIGFSQEALVAMDPATMLQESLQYGGIHSFRTRFDIAKQQIKSICQKQLQPEGGQLVVQSKEQSTQLSKDDEAELAEFHSQACKEALVKTECSQHSAMAAAFIKTGMLQGTIGLQFAAPIKALLKVGRYWFLAGSNVYNDIIGKVC